MTLFAGIDIGGTDVKLGICDGRGRILERASLPTEAARGPADCIRRIAAAFERLRGSRRIRACGAGVPGPLDRDRRLLIRAINLRAWRRVPFPRLLSRALRLPVIMENDANCAAYGEYVAGAGRGVRSMAIFTLGTGVGGGLIIDGKLWIGASGAAGELGHLTLDPAGPRCGCGQRGCVEAYASATAVARRYRQLGGRKAANARDVFRLASRGDRIARRTTEEAADRLGAGVASVLHVLHPELIVLAGGMAAGHNLLSRVRAEVRRRVFPVFLRGLRIERGALGGDAGWIGAALLARDRATP